MDYTEVMKAVDYLNKRMRPLRWYLWPNMAWDKAIAMYKKLNRSNPPY